MAPKASGSAKNDDAGYATTSNEDGAGLLAPTQLPEMAGLNLWQRISWVQDQVHSVPKTGRNTHFNYDYVTENDLVVAIRGLLVSAGIVILFSEDQCDQIKDFKEKESLTKKRVLFTLFNVDSPSERWTGYIYGYGQDQQDKGPYKALTGAQKYFLMKTFMIPTGDDPERDDELDRDISRERSPARAEPRKAAPRQQAAKKPEPEPEGSDEEGVDDVLNGPPQVKTMAEAMALVLDNRVPEDERRRAKVYINKDGRTEGNIRSVVRALAKHIDEYTITSFKE